MAGLGYLDMALTEALWVLRGKLCASGPGTARGEQGWAGGAFAPLARALPAAFAFSDATAEPAPLLNESVGLTAPLWHVLSAR